MNNSSLNLLNCFYSYKFLYKQKLSYFQIFSLISTRLKVNYFSRIVIYHIKVYFYTKNKQNLSSKNSLLQSLLLSLINMDKYLKQNNVQQIDKKFNQNQFTQLYNHQIDKQCFQTGQTLNSDIIPISINIKNWQKAQQYLQFFDNVDLTQLFNYKDPLIDKNKSYTLQQILTTQHLYRNILHKLQNSLKSIKLHNIASSNNFTAFNYKNFKNKYNSKNKQSLKKYINNPQQVQFTVKSQIQNYQILYLSCTLGKYSKSFLVHNNNQKSYRHNYQLQGQGNFSKVYSDQFSLSNFCPKHNSINQIYSVTKCLAFQNQIFGKNIQSFIQQFFIHFIVQSLQASPKIVCKNGFAIYLFEDCFQFQMELCQASYNSKIQQQLKISLLKMHLLNFIHGDIKPTNIMFSRYFNKNVFIDFGGSRLLNQKIGKKTLTYFTGTLAYCSEQMKKLFYQKNRQIIDLYHNDMIGLKNSILQIQKNQSNLQLTPIKIFNIEKVDCIPYLFDIQLNSKSNINELLMVIKFHLFNIQWKMNEKLYEIQMKYFEKIMKIIQIKKEGFMIMQKVKDFCLYMHRNVQIFFINVLAQKYPRFRYLKQKFQKQLNDLMDEHNLNRKMISQRKQGNFQRLKSLKLQQEQKVNKFFNSTNKIKQQNRLQIQFNKILQFSNILSINNNNDLNGETKQQQNFNLNNQDIFKQIQIIQQKRIQQIQTSQQLLQFFMVNCSIWKFRTLKNCLIYSEIQKENIIKKQQQIAQKIKLIICQKFYNQQNDLDSTQSQIKNIIPYQLINDINLDKHIPIKDRVFYLQSRQSKQQSSLQIQKLLNQNNTKWVFGYLIFYCITGENNLFKTKYFTQIIKNTIILNFQYHKYIIKAILIHFQRLIKENHSQILHLVISELIQFTLLTDQHFYHYLPQTKCMQSQTESQQTYQSLRIQKSIKHNYFIIFQQLIGYSMNFQHCYELKQQLIIFQRIFRNQIFKYFSVQKNQIQKNKNSYQEQIYAFIDSILKSVQTSQFLVNIIAVKCITYLTYFMSPKFKQRTQQKIKILKIDEVFRVAMLKDGESTLINVDSYLNLTIYSRQYNCFENIETFLTNINKKPVNCQLSQRLFLKWRYIISYLKKDVQYICKILDYFLIFVHISYINLSIQKSVFQDSYLIESIFQFNLSRPVYSLFKSPSQIKLDYQQLSSPFEILLKLLSNRFQILYLLLQNKLFGQFYSTYYYMLNCVQRAQPFLKMQQLKQIILQIIENTSKYMKIINNLQSQVFFQGFKCYLINKSFWKAMKHNQSQFNSVEQFSQDFFIKYQTINNSNNLLLKQKLYLIDDQTADKQFNQKLPLQYKLDSRSSIVPLQILQFFKRLKQLLLTSQCEFPTLVLHVFQYNTLNISHQIVNNQIYPKIMHFYYGLIRHQVSPYLKVLYWRNKKLKLIFYAVYEYLDYQKEFISLYSVFFRWQMYKPLIQISFQMCCQLYQCLLINNPKLQYRMQKWNRQLEVIKYRAQLNQNKFIDEFLLFDQQLSQHKVNRIYSLQFYIQIMFFKQYWKSHKVKQRRLLFSIFYMFDKYPFNQYPHKQQTYLRKIKSQWKQKILLIAYIYHRKVQFRKSFLLLRQFVKHQYIRRVQYLYQINEYLIQYNNMNIKRDSHKYAISINIVQSKMMLKRQNVFKNMEIKMRYNKNNTKVTFNNEKSQIIKQSSLCNQFELKTICPKDQNNKIDLNNCLQNFILQTKFSLTSIERQKCIVKLKLLIQKLIKQDKQWGSIIQNYALKINKFSLLERKSTVSIEDLINPMKNPLYPSNDSKYHKFTSMIMEIYDSIVDKKQQQIQRQIQKVFIEILQIQHTHILYFIGQIRLQERFSLQQTFERFSHHKPSENIIKMNSSLIQKYKSTSNSSTNNINLFISSEHQRQWITLLKRRDQF